jgi:hypothetical protein
MPRKLYFVAALLAFGVLLIASSIASSLLKQNYIWMVVNIVLILVAVKVARWAYRDVVNAYRLGFRDWTDREIKRVVKNSGWLVEEPVIYDSQRGQGNFRGYVKIFCGPIGNWDPGMRKAYINIYAVSETEGIYRFCFRELEKRVGVDSPEDLRNKVYQYACDRIQTEIIQKTS